MVIVLAAALPMLIGQAHAQWVPPLRFTSFSTEDGLSSLRVWDVLQDRRGFLWIATGDGLNRYDGHRVTVFHAGGPGMLSHDQVWTLFEDHEGILWVGTYGGGLNRFDPATQTFISYRHDPDDTNSLGHDHIRDIHESPQEPGILWIATYGGGLDRFDTRTERFSHFRHAPDDPKSLPGDTVFKIFEDHAGTIWVGTSGGLARLVPAGSPGTDEAAQQNFSFHRVPLDQNGGAERVIAMDEDATGTLWVGVDGKGLYRLQREASSREGAITRFYHDPKNVNSLGSDAIRDIMVDEAGLVWVGTYGRGVSRFDPSTDSFTQIRHRPDDPHSLSHDIIRTIYEDRSGMVWVGTFGGGISRFRSDKFFVHRRRPDRPDGLLPGRMSALAEGADGAIWVGIADGGLTQIIRGPGQIRYRHLFVDPDKGPGQLRVMNLLTMKEEPGTLWVGTQDRGLFKVDEGSGSILAHHDVSDRPRNNTVMALHASACTPGRFWMMTPDGLNLFDPTRGRIDNVLSDASFGETQLGAYALQISVEDPCTLWLTASRYGLARIQARPDSRTPADSLRPYEVTRYPYTGLGTADENDVLNLYTLMTQTPDGRLWLSRLNGRGGLIAFDPDTETFSTYTQADGLLSDVVYQAEVGDDNRLWVANGFGLSALDLATGSVQNYGNTDGLAGTEWKRTALKGSDGTLYFGGDASLTEVPPGRLPHNDHVPLVALTGFHIGDVPVPIDPDGTDQEGFTLRRSITYTDALTLPPDADVLTFEFAALDFTAPEKNRYIYRMEGFDPKWREAGTENTATYTNLDPGRYVFRVRGSNNDGVWNEEGTRLAIRVLPPWYQTPLAYAMYLLLAIGGLMAFVYRRERRLRQRATELETAVAERTERLRQQQIQLEDQTQALQAANAFQSRFLANISHEFRTPLTLTFGPINDALTGRFGSFDAARPHFERARRNGQRLLRLINQLLELSRLDAGALRLDAQRYDLARHLREIASLFQDIARHRRLAFAVHLPDEPVWHVFDADKIEQVVINLLSNAVKFTPPGGAVSLSLVEEADGAVRIVVADTGPGIAAEHQPHLFDRFYQVEDTETRAYEGSGIGLALVKELVALHQGRITVESIPGKGTTFTVYLPVLEETKEEIVSPAQHQGDGSPATAPVPSGEHLDLVEESLEAMVVEPENESTAPEEDATVVLIVEDNADMRAYLRSHLEADYTILEAPNGQRGLAQAQEWVPDLVLSDVMMPEMDGLALTEALKQDIRTSHIPVVLLTAKEEVEHRIAGFASGADAYLPKPFDAEELCVRVRTLIEERRRLRALFTGSDTEQQEATATLPASEQIFLTEVHDYIVHHMNEADFSVDNLAEGLHLSRRQLLRKLQALTDESPGALLRRMRMEQAIVLLREGASAKEVAHAVGFRDYSAFWRAFNKVYGTSPSAYLENT